MSELQRLTERLGERLSRSVAIDDVHLRLQAYSPHYGAVDAQRLASVLRREATPEAAAWAVSHGMHQAGDWVRIPANPAAEMLSRICVPIRLRQMRLGFLWLIDADESLTAGELALAVEAAAQAAEIMHRESLTSDLRAARERELLRDLLDDDAAVRRQAVAGLAEESLLELHRPVQALVLDLPGVAPTGATGPLLPGVGAATGGRGPDGRSPASAGAPSGPVTAAPGAPGPVAACDLALASLRRQLPARRSLHLTRPDHGLLLVVVDPAHPPVELADRLVAEYRRYACRPQLPLRVGVGSPVHGPDELRLSARRARTASQVGAILGLYGVVEWSDLGIYRLLAVLPREEVGDDVLHPGLARLAESPDGPALLETLEVFLDRAGDVAASASELYLHRTTLYHRLAKIERIGGVDLKRGADRLDLHLSLKLARLHRTVPGVPQAPAAEVPVRAS